MAKAIYKRSIIEKEMGFVATQNFLAAHANRAYENGMKVVRVWMHRDGVKVLDEVVLSK